MIVVKLLKILVPTVVLSLAIFLGWLNHFPMPEAALFTMIYTLSKGYVPPLISGGFKDCPVAALPENDNTREARPAQETFITLPGSTPTSSKHQIPQQGIGMCCRYTAYDAESVRRTILWYLKLGGRHIDTADLYLNQEWIGEAIRMAGISRDELWVTTKLSPRSFGENSTRIAVARMVQELQLDYIDMVLMHAPSNPFQFLGQKSTCEEENLSAKECRQETWKTLSSIVESGIVRHIGVSNFNVRQMKDLLELGDGVAPIANNQFQYNPWMPDDVHETFAFCREQGISVTAWSSFAGSTMQHLQAFSVETLQTIAQAHDTTVAQVLLKWAMQQGAIVIPGTANPKHMRENLNAFELELTDLEMEAITNLRKDESAKKFFVNENVES